MAQSNILDAKIPADTRVVKDTTTKESKDSTTGIGHTMVLDFSGCVVSDLLAEVVRSVVIKIQGRVRRDMAAYPAGKMTINVASELRGQSGVVMSMEQLIARINALPADERRAAISKLTS